MTCNIQIQNIADALVEWEPVGEITGFADGSDSISIEWADEGKNTMKVAADGSTGTLSANNRTNGTVKLKLNPGSPLIDVLRQTWQSARTSVGNFSVVNVSTGESHMMECAALESVPPVTFGSEAADEYEFSFLFLRSNSTPGMAAQNRIQASVSF